MAVRSQDWKLVQPGSGGEGDSGENSPRKLNFQLFDMANDPLETRNVAAKHPERVAELKTAYDAWFDDITHSRDFSVPQRIFIGAAQENPVLLTRQDWRGPKANWSRDGIGYWELNVVTKARYDIKFIFNVANTDGQVKLACAGVSAQQAVKKNAEECVFKGIELPAGNARLEATLDFLGSTHGVKYVEVNRLN
jgi:hypothetical protein